MKVGFLLSIQNGQMIHFLLIPLLLVGAWLFRSLLLKFGSFKWGGVESSGVGIKVEKNFVGGGDPDEAVLLVG